MIKPSVSIKGPYTEKDLKTLSKYSQIDSLNCTEQELVTAGVARGFARLKAVKKLWIWSSVTRTAMRDIIRIPKLEVLDILEIKYPGQLMYFEEAVNLKEFRCNNYMSERDLYEISNLSNLIELGAQGVEISPKSLEAVLSMPKLSRLDLEGSEFNDDLAAIMAQSKQILNLEIGSSNLTGKGLKSIAKMTQLKSLDIWANPINESDLIHLIRLENLEYLSLGGYEGQTKLTYQGINLILNEMHHLKRLRLDGVDLTDGETSELNDRYEYYRN